MYGHVKSDLKLNGNDSDSIDGGQSEYFSKKAKGGSFFYIKIRSSC